MEAVKNLVFNYYMGYWNNRQICHAIGGISPKDKRESFYQAQQSAAKETTTYHALKTPGGLPTPCTPGQRMGAEPQ